VLVLVVGDEVLSCHDVFLGGILERPLGFRTVLVGGNADGRLGAAAAWRRLGFVVAKGGNTLELSAHGALDPIGADRGSGVYSGLVAERTSLTPRHNTNVGVDIGSVALAGALDNGTARIALARILSTRFWESSAHHGISDLSIVGICLVAGRVTDNGYHNIVNKVWPTFASSEGTQSHDHEIFSDAGDVRFEVEFQFDLGFIDVHWLVELAEGKIVVDVAAFRPVLGIRNPGVAKAFLRAVLKAHGFVGTNAELQVLPVFAMRSKENNIGGNECTAAIAHFDEVGVVTWIGLRSTNNSGVGGEDGGSRCCCGEHRKKYGFGHCQHHFGSSVDRIVC